MRCLRAIMVVAVLVPLPVSCVAESPRARAERIVSRAQLIGGPRALGEVGDWLIANDKVRFVIQDEGFSRGFGVFGGAILDADIVRPESALGDSSGGGGRDNFGEMFPAFFLQALNPFSDIPDPQNPGQYLPAIEVEADGSDGGDAVLLVRALGDDFLAITESVNEIALGDDRELPRYEFETRYRLKPGARHLELETLVRNRGAEPQEFPKDILGNAVPTPVGDVVLFGGGNKVFLPHEAGFDLRFRLEKLYADGSIALPAFPGLVADFIASTSKDVSYGVMAFAPTDGGTNFALANQTVFPEANETSIHVPFIASAFTGIFQVLPPRVLEGNDLKPGGPDEFTVRRALIVGDGDIASISDVVYAVRGGSVGTVKGRVQERQAPRVVEGASVIVLSDGPADGTAGGRATKVTQARTDAHGYFNANLRPGNYRLVVVVPGQNPSDPVPVSISAERMTFVTLEVDAPAEVVVTVVEENAGPIPAKVTLVGTSSPEQVGLDPKETLFDLSMGQQFLYTDMIPDDASEPQTRRYIEAVSHAGDGVVRLRGRPGRYTLVVSRGLEYDVAEIPIELVPGEIQSRTATLRRAVNTAGYIGADFHLHSQFSLDSNASVDDRLANYAAEGVEYAVSTDHNFVVDYQPAIERLRLGRYINSAVGLELTTIDRGHFNGFPLERGSGALSAAGKSGGGVDDTIASRTFGSFQWALRTPDQIFSDLRARGRTGPDGKPLPIIVQVNHPRDSILGYFDQYGLQTDSLPGRPIEAEGITNLVLKPNATLHSEFDKENFSKDFDAIEVFNGKRFEILRTFTVPEDAPRIVVGGESKRVDPVSCCEVAVGEVVRERRERVCPGDIQTCGCDEQVFLHQLAEGTCEAVGDIAFPGVIDDWVKLLQEGRRIVGTANSDSHEPDKEEPGSPRTFVRVPTDDPSAVTPEHIVTAFRSGDVLMSNGPFVTVQASGATGRVGLGGTATAEGGQVALDIRVQSAPWVRPNLLRVLQDGVVVHAEPIDGRPEHRTTVTLDVVRDGFVFVEVSGTKSLFPVVYPNEIPPLQFSDVIGSLGSSFGIPDGNTALAPRATFVATPYALTNPIWLDADGDGRIAPTRVEQVVAARTATSTRRVAGLMAAVEVPWVPTRDEAAREAWLALPVRKRLALSRLPRWLWPSDDPRDVRRALMQFVRHAD